MTDVSPGFRPPCWCPSRWAPTWRLHTNLYKFGKNVYPHIFHKKNSCDLNLGEGLCISTFFLFPDSGLNLLNDFDFLFWSILNGVTLKTTYTSRIFNTSFSYLDIYIFNAYLQFLWDPFKRFLLHPARRSKQAKEPMRSAVTIGLIPSNLAKLPWFPVTCA